MRCGTYGAVNGFIVRLDIDGIFYDCSWGTNHHGFRVRPSDTIALRSRCHDDELQIGGFCRRIRQLGGETVRGKSEFRFAWSIHSDTGRRRIEGAKSNYFVPPPKKIET